MVFTRTEVKVREERGRAGGRQAEGQRAMQSHVEQDVWTPSSHKLFKTKQNKTKQTKQNKTSTSGSRMSGEYNGLR